MSAVSRTKKCPPTETVRAAICKLSDASSARGDFGNVYICGCALAGEQWALDEIRELLPPDQKEAK